MLLTTAGTLLIMQRAPGVIPLAGGQDGSSVAASQFVKKNKSTVPINTLENLLMGLNAFHLLKE